MPIIKLPDGSEKNFPQPVSVGEVAAAIGPGLAKAALAAKVNDRLVDLSHIITQDSQVAIITERDVEGLEVIRHSTAHLLAHAVKELFPKAQVTIGPVIEDGFYYDFSYANPFTPEDLAKIEVRMQQLVEKDFPVSRRTMPRDEAIKFFRALGEEYKAKIIADIPGNEEITVYQQGDFIDLCRGPHVPSTGRLKAFKLTKVAGAYWRGDANNEMLQRIYGTAWQDKKALQAYLTRLEEAEKRDHRKIAKKMDLFHQQEEAPGMVFWHANGWTIYQVIEQYIRNKLRNEWGYEEVRTPQILDRSFWEKSGHWQKYQEEMFITESEKRMFAIKPMNCPCHVQIFKQGLTSYRDLPIRIAEFGSCHRNEPSGALHGLMRVRNFVQDDGHIFCTEDQIGEEISRFIKQLQEVYADFGFNEFSIKLSTRPAQRIGSEEAWDKAEKTLTDVLNQSGLEWQLQPGDGAFYGPKIEFVLKDSIGRTWTCGTVQLDPLMPERLGAHYVAEDSSKQVPVMLHRAIVGSMERFIGILIEHYAGSLPVWLAPLQAVVVNITGQQVNYALEVTEFLKNRGLRVNSDLRNEKISYKIREHAISRVPYVIVLGDREMAERAVSVRKQSGEDLGTLSLEAFADHLLAEVAKRSRV